MNAIRFFANKNYAEIEDPVHFVGHRRLRTDLFELQMGLIDIGNGQVLWGGTLQNVSNGEKRFFKGWSDLVANLQEILTPSAQLEVLKALIRTKDAVY
ncbi:MAG TPA: hypothetical protein VFM35_03630 [Candidatus Binatia bacterium]|nr:hypothetical protein [Candidatus Binatia bacterium]